MTHNAASKQDEAERQEDIKRERQQELDDVKKVIKTPAGLRLFRRLFEAGHMFRTTYTGNSQGYFLEGHRNFALMFFQDVVEVAPEVVPEFINRDEEN